MNIVAELELAKDMEVGLAVRLAVGKVELGCDRRRRPGRLAASSGRSRTTQPRSPPRNPARARDRMTSPRSSAPWSTATSDWPTPSIRPPASPATPVRKVEISKLRDAVRSRGFLETDDEDNLTSAARKHFQRAKTDLIASKRFIEADGKFWKLAPEPPL